MIRNELGQGWTARSVYDRHHDKLGIMSYRQFLRHIAQELGPDVGHSAVVRSPPRADASPASPLSTATPLTDSPSLPPQGSSRAGHHSPSRTFNHDPIERPDDRRRLLGED
jgi:hypothetical protein